MKITEFPSVTALKETNMFLLDGPNGTKIIYAPDLAKELLKLGGTDSIVGNINLHDIFDANPSEITNPNNYLMIGTLKDGEYANKSILLNEVLYYLVDSKSGDYNVKVPLKRMLFRGRNLGSVFTDEQKAAIADGSFKDLFLGDYWSIGGRIWRIVDFDYWYGLGNHTCNKHHLNIVPDKNLYSKEMSSNNTTDGGYAACDSVILSQAKPIVLGAFGGQANILKYYDYKINSVTDGIPHGGLFYETDLTLMSEIMLYGSNICNAIAASTVTSTIQPNVTTINSNQLALFQIQPRFKKSNEIYWLRDITNAVQFCAFDTYGAATSSNANISRGVRPVFGLIG